MDAMQLNTIGIIEGLMMVNIHPIMVPRWPKNALPFSILVLRFGSYSIKAATPYFRPSR